MMERLPLTPLKSEERVTGRSILRFFKIPKDGSSIDKFYLRKLSLCVLIQSLYLVYLSKKKKKKKHWKVLETLHRK